MPSTSSSRSAAFPWRCAMARSPPITARIAARSRKDATARSIASSASCGSRARSTQGSQQKSGRSPGSAPCTAPSSQARPLSRASRRSRRALRRLAHPPRGTVSAPRHAGEGLASALRMTGTAAHSADMAALSFPVAPRCRVSLHDLELVHPPAAVLRDIDVPLGVHRNAMRLIELTRQLADAAEARHGLAGLAVNDVDLRIVLVDDKHVGLLRVGREIDRHGGAAEL